MVNRTLVSRRWRGLVVGALLAWVAMPIGFAVERTVLPAEAGLLLGVDEDPDARYAWSSGGLWRMGKGAPVFSPVLAQGGFVSSFASDGNRRLAMAEDGLWASSAGSDRWERQPLPHADADPTSSRVQRVHDRWFLSTGTALYSGSGDGRWERLPDDVPAQADVVFASGWWWALGPTPDWTLKLGRSRDLKAWTWGEPMEVENASGTLVVHQDRLVMAVDGTVRTHPAAEPPAEPQTLERLFEIRGLWVAAGRLWIDGAMEGLRVSSDGLTWTPASALLHGFVATASPIAMADGEGPVQLAAITDVPGGVVVATTDGQILRLSAVELNAVLEGSLALSAPPPPAPAVERLGDDLFQVPFSVVASTYAANAWWLATDNGLWRRADGEPGFTQVWRGDEAQVTSVDVHEGQIVVAAGNRLWRAPLDTLDFTPITSWPDDTLAIGLRREGSRWIATANPIQYWESADLNAWRRVSGPAGDPNLGKLVWDGDRWWATPWIDGRTVVHTTQDLRTWSAVATLAEGAAASDLAAGNGRAVVLTIAGNQRHVQAFTADEPAGAVLRVALDRAWAYPAVSYGSGRFWLRGGSALLWSEDGRAWYGGETPLAALQGDELSELRVANGRLLAVNAGQRVLATAWTPPVAAGDPILSIGAPVLPRLDRLPSSLPLNPSSQWVQAGSRLFLYSWGNAPGIWVADPGAPFQRFALQGEQIDELAAVGNTLLARVGSGRELVELDARTGALRGRRALPAGATQFQSLWAIDGQVFAAVSAGGRYLLLQRASETEPWLTHEVPGVVDGMVRLGARYVFALRDQGILSTEDFKRWDLQALEPHLAGIPELRWSGKRLFRIDEARDYGRDALVVTLSVSEDGRQWTVVPDLVLPGTWAQNSFRGLVHDGQRHWLAYGHSVLISEGDEGLVWKPANTPPGSIWILPDGRIAQARSRGLDFWPEGQGADTGPALASTPRVPTRQEIVAATPTVMAALRSGIAARRLHAEGRAAYQRKDYAAALKAWTGAAEAGSADAMFNLAVLHRNGEGVPRDLAAALSWYEKAAAAGQKDAPAQVALLRPALRFNEGLAAYQAGNFSAALAKWTEAAEAGNVDAMFNLGVMHRAGTGVAADLALALSWYEKALAAGRAQAAPEVARLKAAIASREPLAPVASDAASLLLATPEQQAVMSLEARFARWDAEFSAASTTAAWLEATRGLEGGLQDPFLPADLVSRVRGWAYDRVARVVSLDDFLAAGLAEGEEYVVNRFPEAQRAWARRTLAARQAPAGRAEYQKVTAQWTVTRFSPPAAAPTGRKDYDMAAILARAMRDDAGALIDLTTLYLTGAAVAKSEEAGQWWGLNVNRHAIPSEGTDEELLNAYRAKGSILSEHSYWQRRYATAASAAEREAAVAGLAPLVERGVIYAAVLVSRYHAETGTDEGRAEAFKWLQKAVAHDHPVALAVMGEYYREGVGVPVDLAQARDHLERALALGVETARTSLDQVKAQLAAGGARPAAAPMPSNLPTLAAASVPFDAQVLARAFARGGVTAPQPVPPDQSWRFAPERVEQWPTLIHALEVNRRLFAAGENGFLAEWTNGTWKPLAAGTAEAFVRLASDGTRLVAVGNRGTLVTWSVAQPQAPTIQRWSETRFTGLAFGHGRFVALGDFDGALVSNDGVTWERRAYEAGPYGASLRGTTLVFNGSVFFAPGGFLQSGLGLVSGDGLTWSEVAKVAPFKDFMVDSLPTGDVGLLGADWRSPAFVAGERIYLNGRLTVDGGTESVTLTSRDGINDWEQVRMTGAPVRWQLMGATKVGDRYVAVPSPDGNWTAMSGDGVSWTPESLRPENAPAEEAMRLAFAGMPMETTRFATYHLLASADGTLYAAGSSGLATSKDGRVWVNDTENRPIAWGGTTLEWTWVTGGDRAVRAGPVFGAFVRLANGEVRPLRGLPDGSVLTGVATNGRDWIGFTTVTTTDSPDRGKIQAWRSDDGEMWRATELIADARGYSFAATGAFERAGGVTSATFADGAYVAVGTRGLVMRSADGRTWSRLALGEDLRVASDVEEKALASGLPHRTAWRVKVAGETEPRVLSIARLDQIVAGNGILLVREGNGLLRSIDGGRTWERSAWSSPRQPPLLAVGRGEFWLAGAMDESGRFEIYRSKDGLAWTSAYRPADDEEDVFNRKARSIVALSVTKDAIVAADSSGTLLVSSDGAAWALHRAGHREWTGLAWQGSTLLAENPGTLGTWFARSGVALKALAPREAGPRSANSAIRYANGTALFREGLEYEQGRLGKDVPERIRGALVAYYQASESGVVPAYVALARVKLAQIGQGGMNAETVAETEREVVELIGQAVERGSPEAMRIRAEWYANGQGGLAQDYAQAVAWYTKAAEAGDWPSMRILGVAYFRGEHVTRNPKQGELWLQRARTAGDPDAQRILGELLRQP